MAITNPNKAEGQPLTLKVKSNDVMGLPKDRIKKMFIMT